MKTKSESGQAVIAFVLLGAIVFVVVYLGLLANRSNIEQGAETIGDAVGDAIDNAATKDNIDWQIANGTVVSAWVNNQRIYPNKHAQDTHDAEAILATNCYNDHGAFFIQANKDDDWYFHCLEEDNKTVRTTIWKRIGNQFHLETAYTKGDGGWSWTQIKTFFESKWGATKATFPSDGVLYIDNVPAPYVP